MTGKVLGIDPGTGVTGYGVVEAGGNGKLGRLIECGVIRTKQQDPLWVKLEQLHSGVVELIATHEPDTLAIEDVFYGKNVKSAVTLSHTRGVILLAAAQAKLQVREFTPATVKKTVVGAGGATKTQVAFMVQKLLKLQSPPSPSDAADGVAIALTHLMTRFP